MIKADNFWRDDLDDRPVMVTIRCITYNHGKFIRQALESFVNQNTAFRYEAIIHDDCSTDNTAEIIKEYAQRYPSIIKPIFEEENLFSTKGLKVVREIMDNHVRGKYVALCEGDDYWTNPNKLQMQFDFMESHPEVSLCFHNAAVVYEDERTTDIELFASIDDGIPDMYEFVNGWLSPTASLFFRGGILKEEYYQKVMKTKGIYYGDEPLVYTLMQYGSVWGFSQPMSVYRVHGRGLTAMRGGDFYKLYNHRCAINRLFASKVGLKDSRLFAEIAIHALSAMKRGDYFQGFSVFIKCLCRCPLETTKKLIKWSGLKNIYHR